MAVNLYVGSSRDHAAIMFREYARHQILRICSFVLCLLGQEGVWFGLR